MPRSLILPDKLYSIIKIFAVLILPGAGTFHFIVMGNAYQDAAPGILFIAMLFLGLVLLTFGGPRRVGYDGTLEISRTDASQIHQLEIFTPPEVLQDQTEIRFQVKKV